MFGVFTSVLLSKPEDKNAVMKMAYSETNNCSFTTLKITVYKRNVLVYNFFYKVYYVVFNGSVA